MNSSQLVSTAGPFAQVNGIRIRYRISGSGEPVLLWHGFLGTSDVWRKVTLQLARTHQVIAPDMRGYGDSDKPEQGYDARTLAADFRALVKHLELGPVHLVAHDMGAPPALIWAGEHPEEVRTLTYLDEPVITSECLQQMIQFTPQGTQMGGLWWWQFALAPEIAETLLASHEREFLEWSYRHYCVMPGAIEAAAIDQTMRSFGAPGGVSGAFGVYRAIFETQAQTEPFTSHKVRLPVLGLGGEKSMGDRTRQMLTTVAANVQGGAVAGCGHFIPEEKPEELVARLRQFWVMPDQAQG